VCGTSDTHGSAAAARGQARHPHARLNGSQSLQDGNRLTRKPALLRVALERRAAAPHEAARTPPPKASRFRRETAFEAAEAAGEHAVENATDWAKLRLRAISITRRRPLKCSILWSARNSRRPRGIGEGDVGVRGGRIGALVVFSGAPPPRFSMRADWLFCRASTPAGAFSRARQ
jgi:hypothetical protein